MANEIKDALERTSQHLAALKQLKNVQAITGPVGLLEQSVLALHDAVSEIASVLPEPHRVPKD